MSPPIVLHPSKRKKRQLIGPFLDNITHWKGHLCRKAKMFCFLIIDVVVSFTFALFLSDAVLMNHCLLGRMMTGCFVLQSYG